MNEWLRNLNEIRAAKYQARKSNYLKKGIRYLFLVCVFSLVVIMAVLILYEPRGFIKTLFGYIGLAAILVMTFFLKKVVRNGIFYGYNKQLVQNPNNVVFDRPFSYVNCNWKRGLINESFTLQNKFLSDEDALDYIINKVNIEFDEWCIDNSRKKIFGYILKEENSFVQVCDIEMIFEIKNTRQPKILS